MMKLVKNEILRLQAYIRANEIVYQRCGDLVNVANDVSQDNRADVLHDFKYATGCMVYDKDNSFIREGFADLTSWATEDDVLFLLESIGTLICLPRKEAIEKKIIAA